MLMILLPNNIFEKKTRYFSAKTNKFKHLDMGVIKFMIGLKK